MSETAETMHLRIDELEQRMAAATARIDQARALHETLTDVVGTADTADGQVHVEYGVAGLTELTINPRAMRLVSSDLADEIKRGLLEAQADLRAQVIAAMTEQGTLPTADELESERDRARSDFEQAQRDFTAAMRSAADDIGRAARLRGETGT